jgi:hypothetical protein
MEELNCDLSAEAAALIDLGRILGQNHAFGVVSGRCSAAQAASLHRLREEKGYLQCAPNWDEFCDRYLKMCRSEVDRFIRLWQEFGPSYFELAQLTRISADTYRAIAPSIQDGALLHNGETIELNPENSRKVAAAIAEVRRALPAEAKAAPRKPAAKKPPRQLEAHERIADLDTRCTAIVSEFQELSRKEQYGENWLQLTSVLARLQAALETLALENGLR